MTLTSSITINEKIIDIKQIEDEYSQRINIYKQLEEEGKHTIKQALNAESFKIHNILSRVKEMDSIIGKAQRKLIEKPFEEMTDIVGIRIVCLFLSDIDKIEKVIDDNFEVISKDNKINDTNNSNMFGYMSAHYIVKIKEQFAGFRYDSIKYIPFEIQVRTISMDAWANISHFLEYKSDTDIPPELKRDFNALSGLFYVADTHFEMFYKDRQVNQISISEDVEAIIHKRDHNQDQTLNYDSLSFYLQNKFTNRIHNNDSDEISGLVTDLVRNGYTTIQKLDEQIEKGLLAFTKYEEDSYGKNHFHTVGTVRILLSIVDNTYKNYQYPYDSEDLYDPYLKFL
ncbi:GTP pyrophosphokinase family protein [Lysinibacillus sp. NPDC056959]|uniref:GTP pyrophosphokinase n=1 Tax=Lysinibacillus sp. NPDC056959 TaxID=3345981 RepID=UPI00362C68C0